MKMTVYACYDEKAKAFGPPWYLLTVGTALRNLNDMVNGNTAIAKHPEDYTLYEIGEYDDNTGEHINTNPHKFIAKATEYVQRKPASVIENITEQIQKVGNEI